LDSLEEQFDFLDDFSLEILPVFFLVVLVYHIIRYFLDSEWRKKNGVLKITFLTILYPTCATIFFHIALFLVWAAAYLCLYLKKVLSEGLPRNG